MTDNLVRKEANQWLPHKMELYFLLMNQLLDVKDEVKVVLDEQGWDDLAASEWRMLKISRFFCIPLPNSLCF